MAICGRSIAYWPSRRSLSEPPIFFLFSRSSSAYRFSGMDIDITAIFSAMVPTPWSHINSMTPLQRARSFVVPFEEDPARLELAKSLVMPVVQGRQTVAGVRSTYSHADDFLAEAFNLAADFYHGCLNEARGFLQASEPILREMWPDLEYDTSENCHRICQLLKGKTLSWRSPAIRTFYPPWHFGCCAFVSDSHGKRSRSFDLSVPPKSINYFHNPIDVLVSQRLTADFPGIDTIVTNPSATDIAGIRDIIERRLRRP